MPLDEVKRMGHGPTRNVLPVKPMPKVAEITPRRRPDEQKRQENLDEALDLWRKSLVFPASSVTTILQQVAAPGTGVGAEEEAGEAPPFDTTQILRNQRMIFLGVF